MLTEKEKQGIAKVLEQLELKDLVALTDTVTNRVVSAENRQEAIQAILLYTVNASQLLRRKKVKREHLYQYLANQGHIEATTSDKPFLCRQILKLWGSPDNQLEINYEIEDSSSIQNIPITRENEQAISSDIQAIGSIANEGQMLAENFVTWFYRLLNSAAASGRHANSNENSWGHQHFWEDAKCTVTMMSSEHNTHQDECEGALEVSTKLVQVVSSEKLLLNVNQSSIKGDLDTYGLGRIIASGTVHRFQQCLGIFEQSFGVIRDPQTENNWKIKFTHLKLKAQGQIQGSQTAAIGQ